MTEAKPMRLLPPAPDRCPVCGTAHETALPHNPNSLYYQVAFAQEHGRWPTWKDACAHLSEAVQAIAKEAVAEAGGRWE